ncbi:MAG: hypothetical protein ACLQVD_01380 [Capsulimonadaceae bacterium]
MLSTTYKDVNMQETRVGTGVAIEEQTVSSVQGYPSVSRSNGFRRHDLGIYDRVTADWIRARLRQRFPEVSEPLSESEVEFIKREIADRTL